MKIIAFLALLLLTSACSFNLPGSTSSKKYFVINDSKEPVAQASFTDGRVLRVRGTTASRFIDSKRILFSDDPSTRGFYQFSEWVEPPPRRFTSALEHELSQSNMFTSVVSDDSGASADLQLNTTIQSFYHDTSEQPGVVRVGVEAELINVSSRNVITKKAWLTEVEVSDYNVTGAVKSFEEAVHRSVREIRSWLEEVQTTHSTHTS